jgi:Flp pilus assembly protein TadD
MRYLWWAGFIGASAAIPLVQDESNSKTGFNLGIPINRFAMVATNLGVTLNQNIAAIPQQGATVKPDDYIALGVQKFKKGDYRGALAEYNRAIQLNPNYATAYNYRGFLKEDKL